MVVVFPTNAARAEAGAFLLVGAVIALGAALAIPSPVAPLGLLLGGVICVGSARGALPLVQISQDNTSLIVRGMWRTIRVSRDEVVEISDPIQVRRLWNWSLFTSIGPMRKVWGLQIVCERGQVLVPEASRRPSREEANAVADLLRGILGGTTAD